MRLIEIIASISLAVFVIGVTSGLVGMMLSDTETFQAIDERMAKLIRRDKDDETN